MGFGVEADDWARSGEQDVKEWDIYGDATDIGIDFPFEVWVAVSVYVA